MDKPEEINRSVLSAMAFEMEGLCNGLRHTVPDGLSPSTTTIAIMNKLLEDFADKSDGCVLDEMPPLNENTSPVDLLLVAEVLRSSLMAFLTPDECNERDRLFGLQPMEMAPNQNNTL